MQARLLKYRSREEKYFLLLVIIIFILNFIKPLIDYYFHISQRVPTTIQIVIQLLFFSAYIIKYSKLQSIEFFFLFYVFLRFLLEIVLVPANFFQASVSLVLMFVMIFGIKYITTKQFSVLFYSQLEKIIWKYFYVTIGVSIIQAFHIQPFYEIFSKYGGNLISGNILGVVRTTGGIGGTVIDYAVFIILFYLILLNSYKVEILHVIAIIIASLLAFSRIVFVIILMGTIYKAFFLLFKSGKFLQKILIISCIIFLGFVFSRINITITNEQLQFIESFQGTHEEARFNMWKNVRKSLKGASLIVGVSMGNNTGLPTQGTKPVSADGYFQGFAYDFGILGLTLYILFLLIKIKKVAVSKKDFLLIILLFSITCIINSGITKPSNLIILIIMFGMIKMNRNKCFDDQKIGF